MLKKQRDLVLSIFILGILFIVILLQYVPKYKIQGLLFAKNPQLKTSNVKMQVQQTKWTKPSQRNHNHSDLKTFQTNARSIGLTPAQARETTPSSDGVQRTRVVIVAHGRSGSSFFGGIFNAHPDVFYIYEPLLILSKYVSISSDSYRNKVEDVLHSILNCNFKDNSYLKYLSKFHRHRAMSSSLVSPPLCNVSQYDAINFQQHRKWRRCMKNIPAHALNNKCRKKRHVVIKVLASRSITADFSWLLRVGGAGSSPVHILYLVRDPRAMYFSRYKLGWIAPQGKRKESLENGLADSKIKRTCDIIEQHLRSITQHADHIQVVRYEDLASNAETFIRRLFISLRIRPSENITRWLEEKNHAQVKQVNYFSLFRETKTIVTAWQKSIPSKLVTIVEKRCHRIMKYLGYVPTNGSNTLLRNSKKPLFSDEWGTEQLRSL